MCFYVKHDCPMSKGYQTIQKKIKKKTGVFPRTNMTLFYTHLDSGPHIHTHAYSLLSQSSLPASYYTLSVWLGLCQQCHQQCHQGCTKMLSAA